MNELNELQTKRPDTFMYKKKIYKMCYYSLEATHNGQVSDLIIWRNNMGIEIVYNKGIVEMVGAGIGKRN
mgnify:FL=1|tara:strand:- start:1751 stop:1960 length:210 start_codon:yes stop_codon:yes gene_type:complete